MCTRWTTTWETGAGEEQETGWEESQRERAVELLSGINLTSLFSRTSCFGDCSSSGVSMSSGWTPSSGPRMGSGSKLCNRKRTAVKSESNLNIIQGLRIYFLYQSMNIYCPSALTYWEIVSALQNQNAGQYSSQEIWWINRVKWIQIIIILIIIVHYYLHYNNSLYISVFLGIHSRMSSVQWEWLVTFTYCTAPI